MGYLNTSAIPHATLNITRGPKASPRTDEVNAPVGSRRISYTLGRFGVVTQIRIILQPLQNLLHFAIPIGPKNNQATDGTGAQQCDRETNPKTPKFHVVLKSKVDAQWNTDDIIGTNDREYQT